jgi:hypothetical protein
MASSGKLSARKRDNPTGYGVRRIGDIHKAEIPGDTVRVHEQVAVLSCSDDFRHGFRIDTRVVKDGKGGETLKYRRRQPLGKRQG